MYSKYQWMELAQSLQSIAQAGLTYSKDKYDIERFDQIKQLAVSIVDQHSMAPLEKVQQIFDLEEGYLTPKVDVRGAIFRADKILLVKETIDNCWSLPGGWADVGYTASEVIVKEVSEESGLDVKVNRLLAVLDKKCHPHPPDFYYVYKIFFLCDEVGGALKKGMETSDVQFFDLHNLPALSTGRNTKNQIEMMFRLRDQPGEVLFD